MANQISTERIIPGISGFVSAPYTYTMTYLNGQRTYTEPFAVIHIGSQYTGAASKAIDAIILEASAALAAVAGSVSAGLGAALGPLASIALHWIKGHFFNSDGSVTLQLAYHYIGTKQVGIDPTFTPGGIDPRFWYSVVNKVMYALQKLDRQGISLYNTSEVILPEIQPIEGDFQDEITIQKES